MIKCERRFAGAEKDTEPCNQSSHFLDVTILIHRFIQIEQNSTHDQSQTAMEMVF